MRRTTIFLPDELHSALRHLAIERRKSMAELLRRSVEQVYRNDLKSWRRRQETSR